MFRLSALASFVFVLAGCQTIVVPLVGTQIGRPSAAGSKFGLRATSGTAVMATAQDIAPAVRDPDGNIINPVPGETVNDSVTGEPLLDADGKPVKELETIPYVTADIGIAFGQKYEVGLGIHRGLYFLWDVYRDKRYTFTLSPAFATASVDVPAGDLTVCSATNPDGTEKSTIELESDESVMKARLQNINFSALGAAHFGDPYWYMLSLYAGVGISSVTVTVEDLRTDDSKSGSAVVPTFLFGLNGRLLIFDLSLESQVSTIKNRDGDSRSVSTILATVGLKGDWY